MKNLEKYLTLLQDHQGLLLTSRFSRHYGAQFDIAEGVAILRERNTEFLLPPAKEFLQALFPKHSLFR